MRATGAMIFAGARYSEASADFPPSWFVSLIDDEGNVFENVYAKEGVFQTDTMPGPGTPIEAELSLGKNREGRLRIQLLRATPQKR